MRLREPRQDTKPGPSAALHDLGIAIIKQTRIAAEFVDQKSGHHGGIARVQHRLCADDLGDHPAPVDISDQNHRHIRGAGKAHVGDIPGAQVDLGGAARTLHNHQIRPGAQAGERLQNRGHQPGFQRRIIACAHRGHPLPLHDHLRAHFGFRFQQHRVHVGQRSHPAGPRLQRLRATDLTAIGGHRRIVRHVLRLERPYRQPAQHRRPAQPRHQHGFAHIGPAALNHQRLAHGPPVKALGTA